MHRLSFKKKDSLDTLNTDEWLDEMEKMEKKGVDFVDLSKIDINMKKKIGAVIGGFVVIILMVLFVIFLLWANIQDPIPIGVLAIFIGIPVAVVICILVAMRSRFKEIEGGEEDEAAQY